MAGALKAFPASAPLPPGGFASLVQGSRAAIRVAEDTRQRLLKYARELAEFMTKCYPDEPPEDQEALVRLACALRRCRFVVVVGRRWRSSR